MSETADTNDTYADVPTPEIDFPCYNRSSS